MIRERLEHVARRLRPAHPAPGPHGFDRLEAVWGMSSAMLETLLALTLEHGPVVRLRFGSLVSWIVQDPDLIRHVLVENASHYTKSRNYDGLRLALGTGLVTSEGELWRTQRKLVAPAFTPGRVLAYVPDFVAEAEAAIARWASGPTDVHHDMMELTFRIVGRTLFGVDLSHQAATVGPAFDEIIHFAERYSLSLVRIPVTWPIPRNVRFRKAMATLHGLVEQIIRERTVHIQAGGEPGHDVLGALLTARGEDGRGMGPTQLRDEVLTLVGAGHETTANALAFTLHLLSLHPTWRARVEAELDAVLGGRSPTATDLPRLELLERVLEESMRLLPPVFAVERAALAPDQLGPYRVEAGDTVATSIWTLHRLSEHWPNPEGFDPDRFLPEAKKARHRFAYMPFGAGPRICVGATFAMLEAKAILAVILQRVRFESLAGFRLVLDPSTTLRPRNGLRMMRVAR